MAKVFEIDANVGEYDNISGLIPDVKSMSININEKGKTFNNISATGYIMYNNFDWTNKGVNNEYWVEIYLKGQGNFFANYYTNIFGFGTYGINPSIRFCTYLRNLFLIGFYTDGTSFNGYINSTSKLLSNKINHIVIGYNQTTKLLTNYINGIPNSFITTKPLVLPTTGQTLIGGYLAPNGSAVGTSFNLVRVYNSQPNITELYQDFLQRQQKIIPSYKQYAKPTESCENGLIAHYTFQNKNIKRLTDISGNGNHGILTGSGIVLKKDGIGYSGRAYYQTPINVSNLTSLTICGIFKRNSTNDLLQHGIATTNMYVQCYSDNKFYFAISGTQYGGTAAIMNTGINSYVLIFDGSKSDNATRLVIYINGVKQTLSFAGTIPTSIPSNAANYKIGTLGGSFYSLGCIDKEQKIYNRAFSDIEAKMYHNNWASKPIINEQFINEGTDGNYKVIRKNFSVNGNVYKQNVSNDIVPIGTNYMISPQGSIKSEINYGTWEWSLYKTNFTNFSRVFFNAKVPRYATQQGTEIWYGTNGELIFYINSGERFKTANNYIQAATWYRYRMTRSLNDTWTLYIKGGIYTNWTIVSVSSGSNPITTGGLTNSRFFFWLNANNVDRIADIKIFPSIIV